MQLLAFIDAHIFTLLSSFTWFMRHFFAELSIKAAYRPDKSLY